MMHQDGAKKKDMKLLQNALAGALAIGLPQ
jgi:hypothetical protein